MPNGINFRIEIYPVVGFQPGEILAYKWKLVQISEDEALAMSPQPYDTPEQAYLAALHSRWIMAVEGLAMLVMDESGEALPKQQQTEMREEATVLLRKLKKKVE